MSPYSIHSQGTRSHHPLNPHRNVRVEHSGSVNQQAWQDARPPLEPEGQRRANTTLSIVHDLLSQVLHQAILGTSNGVALPPDFLKIATILKTLRTYLFNGEPDHYQADAWLQCVEKKFSATRCTDDFKRDVGVYHLEKEALSWWESMNRQQEYHIDTWEGFKKEFEQKYFPSEARDHLANEFMRLNQGEKSVREYEAEFMRLQRYISYCNVDDEALVRQFMEGLKPEIESRLQSVTFSSLHEVIERAVDVEAYLQKEKAAWKKRKMDSRAATKSKKGGQKSGNDGESCYTCGGKGHFARSCPRTISVPDLPIRATCYICGEKGHFSPNCPHKIVEVATRPRSIDLTNERIPDQSSDKHGIRSANGNADGERRSISPCDWCGGKERRQEVESRGYPGGTRVWGCIRGADRIIPTTEESIHYKPGVRNDVSIRVTIRYDPNQVRRSEDPTRRPNEQGVHSAEFLTLGSIGIVFQEEGEGVDEKDHLAEDVTILLHGRITVPEGGHLRQEILRMAHQSLLSIHP
ncbi:unnamed protein product [Microthlaspi erraticum]|uniref:CCHC-type domain-containing protein n=1 Tax=Microthlaspi erraticum TaxID=1685480 RepID=A0A6D2KXT8_9BRAS|nr:unnamed protein product [Microthlaspi erraticum]